MKPTYISTSVILAILLVAGQVMAQAPIVKTVPAVPLNPLIAHDTWNGNPITLKGTVNSPCTGCTWTWDPGDGSAAFTGTVTDPYAIETVRTYTGTIGQVFTATLTVKNAANQSGSAVFYVKLNPPPPNLTIEVNHAIDEGLWYLHKTMDRSTCADGVNICGNWQGCRGYASACYNGGYYAQTPANLNAFEVIGFLESGAASNPYTETVQRALNGTFYQLATRAVSAQTNPKGTFTPDGNGNSVGIGVNQANDMYQGGFFMDALAATGTPGATAKTGPAGIVGQTYGSILQDMVDYYAYCQYDYTPNAGGWRYSCNQGPDNSICQWAAIGIIPALQKFGNKIPKPVLDANAQNWLVFSQNSATGYFGYTDSSPLWGPYAVTPSGMVQLAMDGIGRGKDQWDKAETYMRNNFGDPTGNSYTSVKNYFYGLFSFTKAMLLHDSIGPTCDAAGWCTGGTPQPIQLLKSSTAGVNPIDWYSAEKIKGDPTDGVARWLVSQQNASGYWWGHNSATSATYPFETAWAVVMLNRTVFQAVPVACANAVPNPVANGAPIQLDGSCAFDQDPAHSITNWDWDVSGTAGTNFTLHGVKVNTSLSTPQPLPFNYPVRLRVTNNAGMMADTVFHVVINVPPTPPSANAGGPYNFCPNPAYVPWYLDGSHSTNADDGKKDPGCVACPVSAIVAYDWDYICGTQYNSSHVVQPRVDINSNFMSLQGQSFNVCLRVTNNDNLAFPSAGLTQGLSSISSAQVYVHNDTDINCTHCIPTLKALVKASTPGVPGNIQLYWTDTNDALFPIHHYNVYRSESADFSNFKQIAGANSNPYKAPPLAKTWGAKDAFIDTGVVKGTTYFYRVSPATLNDTETCQSNVTLQVTAK